MLNALAAPDPRDPTTLGQPLEDFTARDQARLDRRHARGHARHQAAAELHASRCHQGLAGGRPHLREPRAPRSRRCGCPTGIFDLSRPAGTIIASEAYSLHRDYIENMNKAIGPGVRMRAQTAKSFLAGAYAEEMRAMASRRRAFTEWMKPYDARAAADHGRAGDPARRGRREPRRSRAISRGRPTISACAASPCRRVSRAACRSASRSSASPSPSATCCGWARPSRTRPTSTAARPICRPGALVSLIATRCGMPCGTTVSTIEESSAS